MKREHGLWYVKYHGVWLLGGNTNEEALIYKLRLDALDKIRQVGIY